jgi:hypothetical protein
MMSLINFDQIRAEGNAQNETRRIASDASKEFIFTTTTDATKPEPKKTRKSKYNSAAQLYVMCEFMIGN